MLPTVSVVIPNYNYARYLRQRLDSVLTQTLGEIEVLFLDDASRDDSAAVLAEYLPDRRIRVFTNDANSGSTYVQWRRGLAQCRGEYVWIAEADDYADPRLLEALVGRLKRHPEIGVAYCQSWIVDEESRILHSNLAYTQGLDPQRWQHDYVANGHDELCRALIYMNTIPNASAAVFRRSVCQRVGGPGTQYRLSSDWVFWLRMVLASGVAYVAEPLNYYRCHQRTVRSATKNDGLWIEEMAAIIADVYPRVNLPPAAYARLQEHFWNIWSGACDPRQIPWRRHWRIYRAVQRFAPEIGRRALRHALRHALRLPGFAQLARARRTHP